MMMMMNGRVLVAWSKGNENQKERQRHFLLLELYRESERWMEGGSLRGVRGLCVVTINFESREETFERDTYGGVE